MLPSNARGRLLKRLVTTDCAVKVLEVGTFTGCPGEPSTLMHIKSLARPMIYPHLSTSLAFNL